ncbi:MAG: RecX family transcriptional regulator [Lachnospiraceae bacterium]|nr:RecX family transcriptional regulator [Lachnospiraceae bacterium]
MIVTKTQQLSSSRTRIYLDEEIAFVLYKGELRFYGIREGSEITDTLWQDICENVLKKRARLLSMNLLKERDYPQQALLNKLITGGYPPFIAQDALEYVKSYGYVDDRRYAKDYIENQSGKKSLRRIREDLARKGLSRDLVEEILTDTEEENLQDNDLTLACHLLSKKKYDPQTADFKEKQRIAAWLYRKGIRAEVIKKAMEADFDLCIYT